MHIAILSVRDETYHPNMRLMAAAREMGHRISLIHTRDCLSAIQGGRQQVRLPERQAPDILFPRVGATINDYALSVVRHFAFAGTRVINGFESILMARNKFMGLQCLVNHGVSVPDTFLVVTRDGFEEAVTQLGGYPVVAKIPNSRQGNGVMLVENQASTAFIMNNLVDNSRGILVQAYISPQGRTDVRALVVGDRVVGAMSLTPNLGDFRSNLHLTGHGQKLDLDAHLKQLAVQSTHALGLEVSGCDIMIQSDKLPKVIEVNYSPGFRGLEQATGRDIAKEIIQFATASK